MPEATGEHVYGFSFSWHQQYHLLVLRIGQPTHIDHKPFVRILQKTSARSVSPLLSSLLCYLLTLSYTQSTEQAHKHSHPRTVGKLLKHIYLNNLPIQHLKKLKWKCFTKICHSVSPTSKIWSSLGIIYRLDRTCRSPCTRYINIYSHSARMHCCHRWPKGPFRFKNGTMLF